MAITKVIKAMAEYTGGNVYVFTGKLSDGTYFLSDSDNFDVRILSSDPNKYDEKEQMYNWESYWWQEIYLVRDLEHNEALSFMENAMELILKNKKEGNYLDYDIEQLLKYIKTEKEIRNEGN